MPEVVVCAHAHEDRLRGPRIERVGSHTVTAPVMRRKHHTRSAERIVASKSVPYHPFGITGQDRRERSTREVKDDAGVVRREAGVGTPRPQDLQTSAAEFKHVPGHERMHR